MRSLAAASLATLFSLAAVAQQPGMRAQVMAVESIPAFERWVQNGAAGTYSGALREVPVGRPVHFPIMVLGLQPSGRDLNLVADIEFFAPNGNSLGVIQQCCRFSAPAGNDVRSAVLGNAATLVFGANDMRGNYAVAVSVTDGSRTVTTRETVRFGAPDAAAAPPPPMPSAAAEAPALREAARPREAPPKLRMSAPEKNPGRDADKRDCLALPTPAEIIKCAEKKK